MTINEVKQKTGLTKKAINYYEMKGLINPSYDTKNRYRDFSELDLKKLSIIGFLRQLNISIEKIKYVIDSKISINELLSQQLASLDNDIESLKTEKELIKRCIDNYSFSSIEDVNIDQILNIKNEVELNQFKRENYINSQWQKIFPGKLGRLYAIIYNAYLTDPIDSQEKKKAWYAFIDYLDNIEEIEIPSEIDEILNSKYFAKILKVSEESFKSSIDHMSNLDKSQVIIAKEFSFPPEKLEISTEMIDIMKMIAKFKRFVSQEIQIYLTPLNKHLEILCKSYKKYKENMDYVFNMMENSEYYKPILDRYKQIKKETR